MEKQTFDRHERIYKRKDYTAIYDQGVRRHSRHFTMIACRNQAGARRLGITVSKKVGSAVQRNRIKRLLREFLKIS
jgi:ribonuclease P protein component